MTDQTADEPAPVRSAVLRAPAHRVSSKAPVLWAVGAAARSLLLLGGVVATALLTPWDPAWWWAAPLVLLLATYVVAMPVVRYRIHRWESTDTAVYTQTGWLSREQRIAPMSRVQTVDFEQGPLSRAVGIATVTVTTASAAGPLKIEGIDKAVADRLVEDLTRRAEAEAGDAT